jgi:hypothetical protein
MAFVPQTINSGTLDAFVDGEVISAEGTSPAPYSGALNPKMRVIQSCINDHADWINSLQAQVVTLAGSASIFNVKSPPYNAVGDGITNDTTAIQNAVTDACAVNGVVVFPSGTYKITAEIVVNGSVIITSDTGYETTSIRQYATTNNAIFNVQANNITIEGLTLFPYADTAAGRGLIYAPSASAVEYLTISKCYIWLTNWNSTGLYLDTISKSIVEYCRFAGANSTLYTTNLIQLYNSTDVMIQNNNTVLGNIVINLDSCERISCVNNTILNFRENAIYCVSSINCTIQNNIIKGSLIALGTSNPATIVVQSGCANITVSYNNIDMSTVTATEELPYGVWLIPYVSGDFNNSVIGNTFTACSSGVYVAVRGIYTICDNVFNRCFAFGIRVGTISTGTFQGTIVGNTFVDFFHSSAATGDAISFSVIQSGSRASISGNVIARGSLTTGGTYAGKTVTTINYRSLNVPISGSLVALEGNNFRGTTVLPNAAAYTLYYEEITGGRVFTGTAAPTTGTWVLGDKVLNSNPTPSGYIGWVCTSSGVSGTWKGFGTIQT